jgi:cytochrome P450
MTTDLFHDPQRYGDMEHWRAEALALHADGPIHRIEASGFPPFWAVIGHEELMQVERQPKLFTNEPFPVLANDETIAANRADSGPRIRTPIHMDDPDHLKYRRLTSDWFKPASLNRVRDRLDELSAQALATLTAAGGEIDFNTRVAVRYPLQVILAILGLPESDYDRMLQLTQELFGASDPDMGRGASPAEIQAVLLDFYEYFTQLTADRRAHPRDDLATLIANGTIDGEPMPVLEQMGYYTIVATAGHDTTAAAMAEGMHRLATHPDALRRLRAAPELIPNAVEEMIRLASPVRHFMRHAQADAEVGGRRIAAGDWLMLNYTAANIDPRLFDDPLVFDAARANADKHIAFGFGIHFCLGAQLARMELRSLFSHLVPRLESVELAGDPTTSKAVFVSGHKTLPIRYRLREPVAV